MKIEINLNKTLKLTNALINTIKLEENINFDLIIQQMDNYIKSKGFLPIGPLIQKTVYKENEENKFDVYVTFIRQSNNFIHSVIEPYKMESVLRVKNCMYAHYIGPEDKLKFAYDKIHVTAFEEDIDLSKETYTIFVDKQDDNIVADVFVEKESDE
jgi:hypothetical protein